MSRHDVDGRRQGDKVVVGWDPPLATFFAHVFLADSAIDPDEGGPDVWLGGKPCEFLDLDDIARAVGPYAELAPELLRTLYADRELDR